MATIHEIIANKYFTWCDKMSQTNYTGIAICPANGVEYWFVLGVAYDSYKEYECRFNQHFGCDL